MANVNPVSVVVVDSAIGIPVKSASVRSGLKPIGDVDFYVFDTLDQITAVYTEEQICILLNIQEKTSRQNIVRAAYAMEHDGKVTKQMLIDAIMAGDTEKIAKLQQLLQAKAAGTQVEDDETDPETETETAEEVE